MLSDLVRDSQIYRPLRGARRSRRVSVRAHTRRSLSAPSPESIHDRGVAVSRLARGPDAGSPRSAERDRSALRGPRGRDRQSKLSCVSINTVELLKTQAFGDCWSWFTIFITYNKQYIYRWISFYELLPPLSEPPRSACSSAGAWTEAGTPPRRAWPISTSFLRRIH